MFLDVVVDDVRKGNQIQQCNNADQKLVGAANRENCFVKMLVAVGRINNCRCWREITHY